jgi:hypothetical protein
MQIVKSFVAALGIITVCGMTSAQAAIIYTATFSGHLTTDSTQTITGSGLFTVNGETGIGNEAFPALTNASYVGPEVLSALTINIDGFNFTLPDAANSAAIFYTQNGNPAGLDYYGNLYNGPPGRSTFLANLSVQTDTFNLADDRNAPGISYTGSVTFARAAAVPEPITLAVFGTGLAGVVVIRRRKTKKA